MKNNNNADNPTSHRTVAKTSPIVDPIGQTSQGWTESSSDWLTPPRQPATDEPSPAAISLEATDLSVSYGAKIALSEVSFTLYQGDTLGLLGLNGAGKSTLLKVLSGALAPDTGTVQIGEHELFESTIATRMSIGYAPDKPAIYPEFRVTEYLHFIARMRRIERRRIKTCVDQVIERCALGEVRKRVIGNLSSGYQQRVNIAQALIHTPKILILDEPANGLDPVQLIEMRELISTLAPEQATIFSSHLLPEVNAICNRVLLIAKGQQILDAPLNTLTGKNDTSFEVRIKTTDNFNLLELPGVSHACRTSEGHWLVTGNSLTAQHLETMLLSRGLQVIHIKATDNYLESLFQQLAAGDKSDTTDNHGTKS